MIGPHIYDKEESYVYVTKDIDSKESKDSDSGSEGLYMHFAKVVRKERKKKNGQVMQVRYADDRKEKKCGTCGQCSSKEYRHAVNNQKSRNFEKPYFIFHNPMANRKASHHGIVHKDNGFQLERYGLQDC